MVSLDLSCYSWTVPTVRALCKFHCCKIVVMVPCVYLIFEVNLAKRKVFKNETGLTSLHLNKFKKAKCGSLRS